MKYTKLGNTDIEVSRLCVGCMSFGKAGTMHSRTLDEAETEKTVKHALAWHFAKGVASPIVGATKAKYLDEAVGAVDIELTQDDINYLEEVYVPHPIV